MSQFKYQSVPQSVNYWILLKAGPNLNDRPTGTLLTEVMSSSGSNSSCRTLTSEGNNPAPFSVDEETLQRYFTQISDVVFNMLYTIPERQMKRRLEVLTDKPFLAWAAKIRVGDRVGVKDSDGSLLTGCVRFVGKLKNCDYGTMFGVELDPQFEGRGAQDGTFKNVQYFKCPEDGAMFVNVSKLERLAVTEMTSDTDRSDAVVALAPAEQSSPAVAVSAAAAPHLNVQELDANESRVINECSLSIGERVVWVSDNGPEFGTVRWIGFLPDAQRPRGLHNLTIGVEFDNAVGSGTGRFQSQVLFEARRGHASLVPLVGLMKASDFGFTPPSREPTPAASTAVDGVGNYFGLLQLPPLNGGGYSACEEDLAGSQEEFFEFRETDDGPPPSPLIGRGQPSRSAGTLGNRPSVTTFTDSVVRLQPDVIRSTVGSRSPSKFSDSSDLVASSSLPPPQQSQQQSQRRQSARSVTDISSERKSSVIKGQVQPPSIADTDFVCGKYRGIQGHGARCCVEVVLFILFAYYDDFDKFLFAKRSEANLASAVCQTLIEHVVNPLRTSQFVSSDRIKRFSELLSMLEGGGSDVAALNDPATVVSAVLRTVVCSPALFETSQTASLKRYVYTVRVGPRSVVHPSPSLQYLMECYVLDNLDCRLENTPSSVFIVDANCDEFAKIVNGGRVFPSLTLDISGVLNRVVRPCRSCGSENASVVCGSCFKDERKPNVITLDRDYGLANFAYCRSCSDKRHQHAGRRSHQTLGMERAELSADWKSRLELFAVVSEVNDRFVSFFKVGGQKSSEWLSYDGGMTRNGEATRVPEIKRCPQIVEWLSDVSHAQKAEVLPEVISKLVTGLRLCFYRPSSSPAKR